MSQRKINVLFQNPPVENTILIEYVSYLERYGTLQNNEVHS